MVTSSSEIYIETLAATDDTASTVAITQPIEAVPAVHPGTHTWDYPESGPEVWQVRIGKAAIDA